MKNLFFISGLPRSGTTLITNILKQNPKIHGEAVSSLSSIIMQMNLGWNSFESNQEYNNTNAKKGVLSSILEGYYKHINKPIIFDKDLKWTSLIPLIEEITEKKVKILICVRNPAEIITSFERLRKENPMYPTKVDQILKESSSIAGRAYYYSGPDGVLGTAHKYVQDAIIMGYLDRMIFVDYNKFCNMPKTQTKRIYDFFEIENFEHDFDNIKQEELYNDIAVGLPKLHTIKNNLSRTTVNCVEYLGLDLYDQYNKQIFWNPWI